MFSVIIPLYNKEKTIIRAIDSVLNQTYQNFEIIVINDGSTDNSSAVVENLADDRITLLNQKNKGVSEARNKGVEEANYKYVAFLDADDEWSSDFLSQIIELKQDYPSCNVFATNYICIDFENRITYPIINGLPNHFKKGVIDDYFEVASISDPPLCSSAIVVKRKSLCSVGMFPVGVTSGEDLLTWAKLAINNKIAYSTKHCAVFYIPSNVYERPNRFDDYQDIVGKELILLLEKISTGKISSLKKYIALWYKMQGVSFLQFNNRKIAKHNLVNSIKYNSKNFKTYTYYFLTFMPNVIRNRMFFIIKKLKNRVKTV